MSTPAVPLPTTERWYSNPLARQNALPSTSTSSSSPASTASPTSFHRSFPSYSPTPLVSLPSIASQLNLKHLYVKDESSRLGLPSFKILGASFAVFLSLCEILKLDPTKEDLNSLQLRVKEKNLDVTLYSATDGNHGRAIARMARLVGVRSTIYVPTNVTPRSQSFIESEGAEVIRVDGDYDLAVSTAAAASSEDPERRLLVQDTSWEGYEKIPMWIVEGYTTLFKEVDEKLEDLGLGKTPTMIVVPVGVGSLAHASVLHYSRSATRTSSIDFPPTSILTVEPTASPCLLTSLLSSPQQPITISTSDTIMPGLNCGTVSPLAWPDLVARISGAVSVTDEEAEGALGELKECGVNAGPCGAATLAGLRGALKQKNGRQTLGLKEGEEVVVLVSTEGPGVYLGEDLVCQ